MWLCHAMSPLISVEVRPMKVANMASISHAWWMRGKSFQLAGHMDSALACVRKAPCDVLERS